MCYYHNFNYRIWTMADYQHFIRNNSRMDTFSSYIIIYSWRSSLLDSSRRRRWICNLNNNNCFSFDNWNSNDSHKFNFINMFTLIFYLPININTKYIFNNNILFLLFSNSYIYSPYNFMFARY